MTEIITATWVCLCKSVPADDLAARVRAVRDQLLRMADHVECIGLDAGGAANARISYQIAADLLTAVLEPPAVAEEGSG